MAIQRSDFEITIRAENGVPVFLTMEATLVADVDGEEFEKKATYGFAFKNLDPDLKAKIATFITGLQMRRNTDFPL
jgi:hypothetical protein